MKNWIISETELFDKYLIVSEKAIWISEQNKGIDINELIESKSLGSIKSIRYEDLKEIVFIDSDFTIEFNYEDDKTTDEEFHLEKNTFFEVRNYLKTNLKGTELKNYSIFKQILPNLFLLGVSLVLTIAIYFSATELENGGSISVSGRRGWLKGIFVWIAELLGATGTLILGVLVIGFFIYALIKKIQNPKKGEILKITNRPQLIT
ncbi:MAG: hypothetical protein HKP42_11435 [Maribacter sp.]|nr:hypothetical protein [Eudoraea sp.]NNK76657.1 hypothetical protein [Maribacter sp.]